MRLNEAHTEVLINIGRVGEVNEVTTRDGVTFGTGNSVAATAAREQAAEYPEKLAELLAQLIKP